MRKFNLIKKEIEKIMLNSVSKEDPIHSKLALKWVLKLKPDADIALQIAALGHDIDRCFKKRRIKRENFESYDKYKKQHALMSAKILCEILEKFDFEKEIIDRVKHLVEHHEVGGDPDTEILKEADSLTFFEYNLPFYRKIRTLKETKDKIKFMYVRLSEKAKKLVNQIKFRDKEIDELFKNTISELWSFGAIRATLRSLRSLGTLHFRASPSPRLTRLMRKPSCTSVSQIFLRKTSHKPKRCVK